MPTVSVYVTDETYDKLRSNGKEQDKKASAIIQDILKEWAEEEK